VTLREAAPASRAMVVAVMVSMVASAAAEPSPAL
jgi:hypothetical protein